MDASASVAAEPIFFLLNNADILLAGATARAASIGVSHVLARLIVFDRHSEYEREDEEADEKHELSAWFLKRDRLHRCEL